ncbi:MAG: hypothetical protein GJV46_05360 [Geobacter sp.]|nr:hypothetical protein [Geobacter sp.]
MKKQLNRGLTLPALVTAAIMYLFVAFAPSAQAAFTINVTGKNADGSSPQRVTDYKWLVQEDNAYDAVAHAGVFNNHSSVSVSIHRSSAKVLATGTGANPVVNLPASARYFVSVMAPGYTMTGGAVRPGETVKDLVVYKNPLVAAQIKVLVFQDNAPVNGAPDAEPPLGGFKIILYDQFGQQTQDIFGNPLGTTYNPDGTVLVMGSGNIISTPTLDSGGFANVTIPNLAPGKYGVRAIPQDGRPWVQTSTIEGTPGIDTWVIAGEPPYYTEAGFFGVHAFIGFILPTSFCSQVPNDPYCLNNLFRTPLNVGETAGTITGQVVMNRINRPPAQMGLNPGEPVPEAWVSLSESGATLRQVYAAKCAADGSFSIANVPPGTYSLTMWDAPLDQLIDFRTVTVPTTGGLVALGQVPIFQWFGTYEGSYFNDKNVNGIRDPGEEGIPNLAVGFRFRDGSIYQGQVSDSSGNFSFNEVFPFFKWIIAESDYSRFYPSGATVYVDKGGKKIFNINDDPSDPNSSLLEKRVEAPGPGSLLQGMLLYFDNSARIDWGRAAYPVTVDGKTITNGGISGVISYAFTRAASDPRYDGQSTWEPGQGDVELKLYKVTGFDAVTGKPVYDAAKPVATTVSDSWNRWVYGDPTPQPDTRRNKGIHPNTGLLTGCLDTMQDAGLSLNPAGIPLDKYIDCAETISVWNQTKPAVYDGGYIFTDIVDPNDSTKTIPIPSGQYVVEVIPPLGYEIRKEEDQNYTVSGESYIPSRPQPAIDPPVCVGPDHIVPQFLTFDGTTPAPFAGTTRPLCNKKLITLDNGQNAAADFRIFTQVSLAARLMGLVTDDLGLEFRAGNPRLGDKPGVSFMPISIQDFNGHELVRTYTDEWGIFETLVPSTFTTNIPNPTGVSPHMVKIILNHPGFDITKPDVWYKGNYPTVEWKIDVWPGKITYSDTPIIPIRPNIGAANLDCNPLDGTPAFSQVNGPAGGPWIENNLVDNQLTISSFGTTRISNPDPAVGGVITRDFGFGSKIGTVTLGTTELAVVPGSWTNTSIKVVVPANTPVGAYQLDVMRGDNYKKNVSGITVHVGVPAAQVRRVPTQYTTIQSAINAANAGDLVLVSPGSYAENLIMSKPVKLQGYGAAATVINAGYLTPEKQTVWNNLLASIFAAQGAGKTYSIDPVDNPTPVFSNDIGSGILVLGKHDTANDTTVPASSANDDFYLANSSIDGFQITQANLGSGIYVHAYAHNLKITNNRIFSNQGTYGGGIRIGTPAEPNPTAGSTAYLSSFNDNLLISQNDINSNGGTGFAIGSGGGIGIFEGTDNYNISKNWICGNYATLAGAGIAQQGLSNSGWKTNPDGSNFLPLTSKFGLIEKNTIIFNEAFDEGAGIFLGGEATLTPTVTNSVTPGVGNVVINDNLIQGNKAGNIGGGISLVRYNGLDVQGNPLNTAPALAADAPAWHKARIYNNMIVNNISAGLGGGIGILDAVDVDIVNNTISNNDATATGETAFGNVPFNEGPFALIDQVTTPQPAGIGVQLYSGELISKIDPTLQAGYQDFSRSPLISNNIITGNFSYYWANPSINQIATLSPYVFWDAGVFASTTAKLKITNSVLTDPALQVKNDQIVASATNKTADPQFFSGYRNVIDAFQGGATLGNFITYSYSPLTLTGNYHIKGNSSAVAAGTLTPGTDAAGTALLATDFDGDNRPIQVTKNPDSGADEYNNLGDFNNDNQVNLVDVILVLRQIMSTTAPDPALVARLDVFPLKNGRPFGDGVLNISDALLLLQRSIGLITW